MTRRASLREHRIGWFAAAAAAFAVAIYVLIAGGLVTSIIFLALAGLCAAAAASGRDYMGRKPGQAVKRMSHSRSGGDSRVQRRHDMMTATSSRSSWSICLRCLGDRLAGWSGHRGAPRWPPGTWSWAAATTA